MNPHPPPPEHNMKVEIVQEGRVLRQYNHEGRIFAEAPPTGAYEIRLTNDCPRNRLAVISVDGVNVVNGEDASVDGPGYVMRPWETLPIPGWRRSGSTVAKFTFQPQEGSYANRTGRGKKNNGVIGVAVYEEKVVPLFHVETTVTRTVTRSPLRSRGLEVDGTLYSHHFDSRTLGDDEGPDQVYTSNAVMDSSEGEVTCSAVPCSASFGHPGASMGSTATARGATKGAPASTKARSRRIQKGATKSAAAAPEPVQLGTGYGKESDFFTETVTFERATEHPALVVQVQYAVREQLIKWGVPVVEEAPQPEAFPASSPAVAPPPGWQARR